MREIINGINYVLRNGIIWAALPKEFPPRSTLYRRFCRLRDEAIFEKLNLASDRSRKGSSHQPVISASVMTTLSRCHWSNQAIDFSCPLGNCSLPITRTYRQNLESNTNKKDTLAFWIQHTGCTNFGLA